MQENRKDSNIRKTCVHSRVYGSYWKHRLLKQTSANHWQWTVEFQISMVIVPNIKESDVETFQLDAFALSYKYYMWLRKRYRQTSNIRRTLVGNKIVEHSDVVGASNIRRTSVSNCCWSLRCSWSIACRRCSNYIFVLDLTPGFNGLGKDNSKTRRKIHKCWDLVPLLLEIWRCIMLMGCFITLGELPQWIFVQLQIRGWWAHSNSSAI